MSFQDGAVSNFRNQGGFVGEQPLYLGPSGVVPGTYMNATITVNAQGLVTFADTGIGPAPSTEPAGEVRAFSFPAGTTINVPGVSNGSTNMVPLVMSTVFINHLDFDNGGLDDGTIRYTGAGTKLFSLTATVSASPQTPADVFVLGFAINGVVQPNKVIGGFFGGAQYAGFSNYLTLSTNDKVQIYFGNTSAARYLKFYQMSIIIHGF